MQTTTNPVSLAEVVTSHHPGAPWNNPPRPPRPAEVPASSEARLFNPWPRDLPPATWATMPPDLFPSVMRIQHALAQRANPILLVGAVGTGKSTTAALVASTWPNWRFVACADLLCDLMQARTSSSRTIERRVADGRKRTYTESQLIDEMADVPMLVLDDVGTAELTPPQEAVLLQLVNRRLGDPQFRPLIITTNTTETSLYAAVGNRIGSRLCREGGEVIKLSGGDRRRKRAK